MTQFDSTLRRVFVDTSAWLALESPSDGNHSRALQIQSALRSAGSFLFCTNYIVAETHGLVVSRAGRTRALSLLRDFDSGTVSVVRVEEEDEATARRIIDRYTDKDFSLVDATSFVVMEALDIRTAFAFDAHFSQYGFTML